MRRKRGPKKPPDRGTPENQARRLRLVGKNGDPAKSYSPLAVLKTRELITEDQFQAGERYAKAYRLAFGKVGPRISTAEATGNDAPEHKQREALKEINGLVARLTTRMKGILDNVCVYERYPRYLICLVDDMNIRDSDKADFAALTDGLDIAVKYYG